MRHSHAPVRLLVALLMMLALCAPLAVAPVALAQDVPDEIDLAAVALTSEDVNEAGFDDFGVGRSEMQDAWSFASLYASPNWYSGEEILDAIEDADFVRSHAMWFYDPPDDEGLISRSVFTSVTIFEDDNGAEDAFDFLADKSENEFAEPIDDWDDFGDLSGAALIEDEDGEFIQFELLVVVDNILFMISNSEWEDDEFDERALEDLTDIAIDRIEIGLDAEQPALSNLVLRFETYYARRDFYLWRDEFMNRFYDDDDEAVEWRIEQRETNGQIEHYQMSVQLADFDEGEFDDEFWQYVDLFRFEDEDAAEDWFADRQDFLVDNEFFADIDFEDADLGDESFLYEAEGFDTQLNDYSYVTIRVGEFVVEHGFGGPVPMLDIVEEIAPYQAACLEDDGCIDRIPLPDELDELLSSDADEDEADDPEEDVSSQDEEDDRGDDEQTDEDEEDNSIFPFGGGNDDDDDDAGNDGTDNGESGVTETYEGEFFSFSVSFDPETWVIRADGTLTDDEEEIVVLTHEDGVQMYIIATEEFDSDDLESCLYDAFDRYNWSTPGFDMDDAEDIEVDDDVASFVIPGVASPLGTVAGLTGECHAMVDAVLTVFAYLPADEAGEVPDEALAIAREVIDTIEID